jgi:hypothetical protein
MKSTAVVMPILQIGSESTRGNIYDFLGEVALPTSENVASMGGGAIIDSRKLASGIASAFGDPSPPVTSTHASKGVTTGEWLEITVIAPGKPVEVHRRKIYDMNSENVGSAATAVGSDGNEALIAARSLALIGTVDISISGAMASRESLDRRAMLTLAAAASTQAINARAVKSPDEIMTGAVGQRFEIPLWSWSAGRSQRSGSHSYISSANIALVWERVSSKGELQRRFDIVSNETRSSLGYADNIAQGVFDSVVENPLNLDLPLSGNAAVLMARDLGKGDHWKSIGPTNANDLNSANLTVLAASAIRKELASDHTVILSLKRGPSSGEIAWWRIDRVTGSTLSVDVEGRGTSMVDYGYLLSKIAVAGMCFVSNEVRYNRASVAAGGNLGALHSAQQQAGMGMGLCLLGMAATGIGLLGAEYLGESGAALMGIAGNTVSIGGSLNGLIN